MAGRPDESSSNSGDDRERAKKREHGQTAQAPAQEVGAVLEGHLPDAVEGVLSSVRDAQSGEQRCDDPDRQRDAAPVQAGVRDLIADQRELPERAFEDALALVRVALQHEAEHGHEHEQQREQREKAVEGDQPGELARAVVAELLDHRGDETDARPALLCTVELAQAIAEAHRHSAAVSGRAAGRVGAN